MSQQSIKNINYESIKEKVEKAIVSSYNKNYLHSKFALGNEEDIDVIDHNSIMYDILKNANCQTIELINSLQNPNFKETKYSFKEGDIIKENFYNLSNNYRNRREWENIEWK